MSDLQDRRQARVAAELVAADDRFNAWQRANKELAAEFRAARVVAAELRTASLLGSPSTTISSGGALQTRFVPRSPTRSRCRWRPTRSSRSCVRPSRGRRHERCSDDARRASCSRGAAGPAQARLGRGVYSQVMGHASACPLCGAREKVSVYVLDSIDDRYSHRCTRCGKPSPLREWTYAACWLRLDRVVAASGAGVAG